MTMNRSIGGLDHTITIPLTSPAVNKIIPGVHMDVLGRGMSSHVLDREVYALP